MSSAPTQSGFPSSYHERERELSDVASDFNRETSPLVGDSHSTMTRNSSSVRDSVASDYEVINPIGERMHVPRRFKSAAAKERERSTWAGKSHTTAFMYFINTLKVSFSTKIYK